MKPLRDRSFLHFDRNGGPLPSDANIWRGSPQKSPQCQPPRLASHAGGKIPLTRLDQLRGENFFPGRGGSVQGKHQVEHLAVQREFAQLPFSESLGIFRWSHATLHLRVFGEAAVSVGVSRSCRVFGGLWRSCSIQLPGPLPREAVLALQDAERFGRLDQRAVADARVLGRLDDWAAEMRRAVSQRLADEPALPARVSPASARAGRARAGATDRRQMR